MGKLDLVYFLEHLVFLLLWLASAVGFGSYHKLRAMHIIFI